MTDDNIMIIKGYVNDVRVNRTSIDLKLSIYDGKNEEGKAKYVPCNARVLARKEEPLMVIDKGDKVRLIGKFNKFQTKEANWYERCEAWQEDVKVISHSNGGGR